MTSVFDPSKISFSQLLEQQRAFLLAKPDGEAWADFFAGSAGTTIIEYLAGVQAFLVYHTTVGRAEAYLGHVRKRESAVAIAYTLGHSSYRGRKPHYRLTIIPNFTGNLDEFQVAGTVRGQDVIILSDVTVNSGVPVEVPVAFGDLGSETLVAQSGTQRVFRFTSPDVSEDYRILLNGSTKVPTSTTLIDLRNDKYVVLSNSLGALDAIYLNDGAYVYDTGDDLVLEFIEFDADFDIEELDIVLTVGDVVDLDDDLTAWQASTSYSVGDIVAPIVSNGFYFRATTAGVSGTGEPTWPTTDGDTVTDFGVVWQAYAVLHQTDARLPQEDRDDLRVNAPLTHETQKLIRGRDDYKKAYKNLDSRIVSTNGHDVSPVSVEITAVKDDLTVFSAGEKTAFQTALLAYRPYGVPPAIIVDPVRIDAQIMVDITLEDGVAVPGDVAAQATTIVKTLEKVLEQTLDFSIIESQINRLENDAGVGYILINRVTLASDWAAATVFATSHIVNPGSPAFYFKVIDNVTGTWSASTIYEEGDLVVPTISNGFAFRVTDVSGTGLSGSVEPSWPLTPGATVVDNDITWTNIGSIIAPWQTDTLYSIGDIISPSSASGLFLEAVDNVEDYWQASTPYLLGDLIVPTNDLVNENQYVFEATTVAGAGLSDTSEPPSWPTVLGATVVDNDVTWTNRGTVIPRWQPTKAYAVGDVVVGATPTSPPRAFRIEAGDSGTSGSSEPVWDTGIGQTTADGSAIWTCIELGRSGPSEPLAPAAETEHVADDGVVWVGKTINESSGAEPSWPTVVGRLVQDGGVLWQNVGSVDDPLPIAWDEYFVFTVNVVVA